MEGREGAGRGWSSWWRWAVTGWIPVYTGYSEVGKHGSTDREPIKGREGHITWKTDKTLRSQQGRPNITFRDHVIWRGLQPSQNVNAGPIPSPQSREGRFL